MPVKSKNGDISYVPCGKCLACKLNKQQAMAIRCEEEYKHSACALFLTFTYNNDSLPMINGHPTLRKKDMQNYLKRLRKELDLVGIKVRYVIAGEYGDKGNRPHYHALFFFSGYHNCLKNTLASNWPYGFTYCGTVTHQSINYTLKYTLKSEFYDKEKQRIDKEERERFFRENFNSRCNFEEIGFNEDSFESALSTGCEHPFFGECLCENKEVGEVVDSSNSFGGTCKNGESENGLDVSLSQSGEFYRCVEPPRRLFSCRPGIGYCFGKSINESLDYYGKPGGLKAPLPRYYREKFWTDKHKQQYKEYYEKVSKMAFEQNTPGDIRLQLERRREVEKIHEQRYKQKHKKL